MSKEKDLELLKKLIEASKDVAFNDIPRSFLDSFKEEMVGQTCAPQSTPQKVFFFYQDFLNWYNYIMHNIDYVVD